MSAIPTSLPCSLGYLPICVRSSLKRYCRRFECWNLVACMENNAAKYGLGEMHGLHPKAQRVCMKLVIISHRGVDVGAVVWN